MEKRPEAAATTMMAIGQKGLAAPTNVIPSYPLEVAASTARPPASAPRTASALHTTQVPSIVNPRLAGPGVFVLICVLPLCHDGRDLPDSLRQSAFRPHSSPQAPVNTRVPTHRHRPRTQVPREPPSFTDHPVLTRPDFSHNRQHTSYRITI